MQPIYIEVSDEITTVIERIKESNDLTVALVVPKGAILLQSIVNLKLAKRSAAEAGKELLLITTDKVGRNLASQVGIKAANRLGKDNQIEDDEGDSEEEAHVVDGVKVHRYYEKAEGDESEEKEVAPAPIIPKTILHKKIEPLETMPDEPIVVPSKPEKHVDKAMVVYEPKKRRRLLFSIFYALIIALLAATGVGAFYLPKTTVIVHVPADPWSKDVTVTARGDQKTVSLADSLLPATLLTGEVTEDLIYKATGTTDIGQKATGTATLLNSLNTSSQTVPAGARITAQGLVFITQADATVPGLTVTNGVINPGKASVTITADQSGTDSNLTNTNGSVSAPYSNLYATINSTTGGSTQTVSVVSATDIANAKAALQKKLQDDSQAKIDEQTKGKSYYSDATKDTFVMSGFTPSVASGTQADTVKVSGKGISTRLVVDQDNLSKLAETIALKDPAVNTNYTVSSTAVTQGQFDLAKQTAQIIVHVNGKQATQPPLDSLSAQLVGKDRSAGLNLIALIIKGSTADISQTPSWWPNHNFPFSKKYLTIKAVYE